MGGAECFMSAGLTGSAAKGVCCYGRHDERWWHPMLKAASLAVILTLFTASLVAGDGTQKPAATQPSAPVTPGPGMEPAVRTRIDIKCPAGPTITISTTKSGRCTTIYD